MKEAFLPELCQKFPSKEREDREKNPIVSQFLRFAVSPFHRYNPNNANDRDR